MNGGVGFGWCAGVVFIFRMRCYVCFGTVWRLKDFTRSLLSLSFGIHGRPTRLGKDWPSGLAGEARPPRQLNSHVFFWRAKNGCSTPHEHAPSQTCTHMCSGKRARISCSSLFLVAVWTPSPGAMTADLPVQDRCHNICTLHSNNANEKINQNLLRASSSVLWCGSASVGLVATLHDHTAPFFNV